MVSLNPEAADPVTRNDRYQQLLDEVGAFVYTTDRAGRVTYANGLVLALFGGLRLEDVVGRGIGEFFGEHGNEALRENDERVMRGGETIAREESNFILATGETRHYWSIKKPLKDAAGQIVGMLGISHDITDKRRLEDEVRRQKDLLDTILGNVDALVYMKDADGRFLYANPQLAKTVGLPLEKIIGQRQADLFPADVAARFQSRDLMILASGQRDVIEDSVRGPDGNEHHFWSVVVPYRTPTGAPAVIGFSTDITELHNLKEALQQQSRTDSLTGVANRRRFHELAVEAFELSRACHTDLALIAIDLDHFKRINDRHGHLAGDRVLTDFAACCRAVVREADLVARTGGEEFCILLTDTTADVARGLAERVRAALVDLAVESDGVVTTVSASFGVACIRPGDTRFEDLFSRADRALYAAKQHGRDCVVVYGEDTPATA